MPILKIVFWLILILYGAASAFTILVVLIQSGKGGGLSGLVGAGTAIGDHLGATNAEKALNRWTSYCAVGFLVLNIVLVLMAQHIYAGKSLLDEAAIAAKAAESSMPAQPAPGAEAPAQPIAAPAAAPTAETPAQPATPATEAPAPAAAPAPQAPAPASAPQPAQK